MSDSFKIRPASHTDYNYIVSSFLRSLRRRTGRRHPLEAAKSRILAALGAGSGFVCCLAGDPDAIAGWAVWEVDAGVKLLYCYTKPPYRAARAGEHVATRLVLGTVPIAQFLSRSELSCPFLTKDGTRLLESIGITAVPEPKMEAPCRK